MMNSEGLTSPPQGKLFSSAFSKGVVGGDFLLFGNRGFGGFYPVATTGTHLLFIFTEMKPLDPKNEYAAFIHSPPLPYCDVTHKLTALHYPPLPSQILLYCDITQYPLDHYISSFLPSLQLLLSLSKIQ